ncbi:hypothetical protein [Methylocystis sp.]|uniref:hypothetical protein n=1 Tax=Methylocystis sp. TaxID=1911079 RepID=UPI002733D588|nr:hypothetical protein [Methylocystis sp.]MDP3555500.1 hypothetical protein [Methylocystis sp.]
MFSRQLTWQVDSYLPQARASPLSQLCFQVRQPGFFHGWLSNSLVRLRTGTQLSVSGTGRVPGGQPCIEWPSSPRPGRCRWPLSTQNFWEMKQLTLPPSWQEDLAG